MKLVEYWRWRYRNPQTGHVERSEIQLTSEEARQRYAGSELIPIPGSLTIREVVGSARADTLRSTFPG